MAQQVVYETIPEHPFKIPDRDSRTWVFSDQCSNVSGTKIVTVQFFTGRCTSTAVTSWNDLMSNCTITLVHPKTLVGLDHIVDSQGRTLRLIKPISINATYQENMYFCQNEELGIVTMSAKLENCIKDFQDEMVFVWNEYGKASDDILTDGAKELKRRIQQYLGK